MNHMEENEEEEKEDEYEDFDMGDLEEMNQDESIQNLKNLANHSNRMIDDKRDRLRAGILELMRDQYLPKISSYAIQSFLSDVFQTDLKNQSSNCSKTSQ